MYPIDTTPAPLNRMATAAIAEMALRAWISRTDFGWLLTTPTTDLWWYTGVPVVLCFIAVTLFFRHITTVIWFSVKLSMALVVYLQVRGIIASSIEGDDPLSIEATVLGIPPGTIANASSSAVQLVATHAIGILTTACPSCFPVPIPPPPPPTTPEGEWVNWVDSILAI
jgi:hypothetical protein